MGRKEKKKSKDKSRSRSRSRERSRHSQRDPSASESDEDSVISSESQRKHSKKSKKHKSRDHSDSRTRSTSPTSDASKKQKKKKKSKARSRSRERRQRSISPSRMTQEESNKHEERKRKEKELIKAMETPEEKRARRLGKKEAKERKRKENMGWDEEYMGYSNTDNPFGDEHLWDTFVWKKKMEKEGKDSLTQDQAQKMQKMKTIENKIELEKVKKCRLEREREREERDREREMMQREKEADYFREWEMQEDTFHLKQAKLRSTIRIEDGRAKPIDLLAKYISAEDDELAIEMHEPYTYLNGLTIQDLEDLLEDIKVYVELEQDKNAGYWRDITIITEDELNTLKRIDPSNPAYVGDRRSGINESVTDDVVTVFKGKTLSQLKMLENQIRNKLKGGEGIDIGYWESLLSQLKAHMARTRLRERHQEQLRSKLFKLKQEQGIESGPLFPIIREEGSSSGRSSPQSGRGSPRPQHGRSSPVPSTLARASPRPATSGLASKGRDSPLPGSSSEDVEPSPKLPRPPPLEINTTQGGLYTFPTRVKPEEEVEESSQDKEPEPGTSQEPEEEDDEQVLGEEDLEDPCFAEYEGGGYSPRYFRTNELEPDQLIYEEEADTKRLDYARSHLLNTGTAKEESDLEFIKKAREGMNDEEAQFSVQVPLEHQTLLWSDKYRPRKPRFFNRVHTGFEWNKYNQTHYDIDNPPPKIVQGYKFNIFYPDLIDKAQTPQYTITPIEDNKDFGVLRFHAGAPYEDIAFKIVNREWEYSYKRGFRCQFHNNIFQLWFHFKRYRYRR